MSTRTASSTSTILLTIVLILTFPIWIGIAGGLFGLVLGACGIVVGVFAAVFGAMIALVALPFKIIFGFGHWGWHGFPHFHFGGLTFIVLIIIAALIIKRRNAS